jgi:hypothetical protein
VSLSGVSVCFFEPLSPAPTRLIDGVGPFSQTGAADDPACMGIVLPSNALLLTAIDAGIGLRTWFCRGPGCHGKVARARFRLA